MRDKPRYQNSMGEIFEVPLGACKSFAGRTLQSPGVVKPGCSICKKILRDIITEKFRKKNSLDVV